MITTLRRSRHFIYETFKQLNTQLLDNFQQNLFVILNKISLKLIRLINLKNEIHNKKINSKQGYEGQQFWLAIQSVHACPHFVILR